VWLTVIDPQPTAGIASACVAVIAPSPNVTVTAATKIEEVGRRTAPRRFTIGLSLSLSFVDRNSIGRVVVISSRCLLSAGLSALAAATLAACGNAAPHAASTTLSSAHLVEAGRPPYITGLAVDPSDHSLLLATNTGLYRISANGRELHPVQAHVTVGGAAGPYGERVSSLAFEGPGRLLGSGHPNRVVTHLPPFLGLLVSTDGGRDWSALARAGFSDLHVLLVQDRTIYAFDTVLGGVVVSTDGGHTFAEGSAPAGPTVLDMAVDPKDARYVLASTPQAIFASSDQGMSWRQLAIAAESRLTWMPAGLFRADADGNVLRSSDRGRSWTQVGKLAGAPGKLVETAAGALYAALDDGRIATSLDGGRQWSNLFSPDA